MTDPVRCELDRSQVIPTYDCQAVELTSTAAVAVNQCLAEPDQSLSSDDDALSSDPAVKKLVNAIAPLHVSIPPADVSISDLIVDKGLYCLGEVDALALLIANGDRGTVLGILAGFKVGWDVGKCGAVQRSVLQEERTVQAAEDYCRSDGGEPRAWLGERLQCIYSEAEP